MRIVLLSVDDEFAGEMQKYLYKYKSELIGKFRAFRTPIPGDSGHEFRINSDSNSGLISDSFAL